ncbi:MAG: alkaline phosphatase family protein [Peptococcaceae bacterium]|nr:alkaline phosphatase family protein [Peptococcaceae bacterium]
MSTNTRANKLIVLGIDGMDPRLTRKYVDAGAMPNLKKIIEKGVCREDLVLLGAHPTITPPMWTTLATGAYPSTHGITCFWRKDKEDLDAIDYNLNSENCQAEQIWNIFAEEADKKTLVWHWPGSSWPPTSKSPNLHVVDGSQPSAISLGIAMCDGTYVVEASSETSTLSVSSKEHSAAGAGCIIDGLEVEGEAGNVGAFAFSLKPVFNIMLTIGDGEGSMEEDNKIYVHTPLKEASGWEDAPSEAKEFAFTLMGGYIRRWALVTKNEQGIYDSVAIYANKKSTTPLTVLKGTRNPDFTVLDTYHLDGEDKPTNRMYTALEIAPDGSNVRMLVSSAMDYSKDELFYPRNLYKQVTENIGYVPITPSCNGDDQEMVESYLLPAWENYREWQGKAINYLIEENGYEVVFSHLHNIDCLGHNFWMYAKSRAHKPVDEVAYQGYIQNAYEDTDRYFGQFMHLLDEGWTIAIVSDHGLLTRQEEEPALLGDPLGVNAAILYRLGYTALKKTPEGKLLKEIDWEHTKAIATRGSYIWINVKGRDKYGIVDPEDKYQVEEQLINDLYNYRDQYGNRVVSLVLRNKDAAILGLDGPETGDLVYFTNEGTNRNHGDSLSTTLGYADTSVSPIFVAAGPGFKEGQKTDRVIRQVDFAPTLAYIMGIRQPKQSEGSIVHQIIDRDL